VYPSFSQFIMPYDYIPIFLFRQGFFKKNFSKKQLSAFFVAVTVHYSRFFPKTYSLQFANFAV